MSTLNDSLKAGNIGVVVIGGQGGLIIEGTGVRKIVTLDAAVSPRPKERQFVVVTRITKDLRPANPESGLCVSMCRPLQSTEITPAIFESDSDVKLCQDARGCSFEMQPIFRLVGIQDRAEEKIAILKVAYRLTGRDKIRGNYYGEMIGSWGAPQSFPMNPRPYCQETDAPRFFFSRNYGKDHIDNPLLLSSTAMVASKGAELWDKNFLYQPIQGPRETVNQVIEMLRKPW